MITQEKLQKMKNVAEMIIEDMPADVKRHSSAPFTGRTLGIIHGELCATVEALAKIILELVDDKIEKEKS